MKWLVKAKEKNNENKKTNLAVEVFLSVVKWFLINKIRKREQ